MSSELNGWVLSTIFSGELKANSARKSSFRKVTLVWRDSVELPIHSTNPVRALLVLDALPLLQTTATLSRPSNEGLLGASVMLIVPSPIPVIV